ncbi:MAG: hypothetical protein NT066_01375, partial [Candidatus Omnitrophica bacterium]|nr:hypothetical protein [Candidatus Omnitrophota bacterium]
MVRISDILKQGSSAPGPDRPGKEKKEGEPRESPEKTEEGASRGIQFAKTMPQEQSPAEKEVQVAKAMHKMQIDPEESRDIYNRALEVIRGIFKKVESDTPVDLREAYNTVEIITDRLVLGDKELIALTSNYSQDNYLYAHSINICILSIYVGLGLGYNKSKLHELGLGALLHDLGMIKVMGIISQQRTLNE